MQKRRFAGERVRLPREREGAPSEAAPAEAALCLAGAIGSRAFSALVARYAAGTLAREQEREEYVVRFGHVVIRADTPAEQAEAHALADRLRDRYGITLDSATSIEKLRDKYRRKRAAEGGGEAAAATAFDKLLETTIRGEAWRLSELRALEMALDTPLVAGSTSGVRVHHLRNLGFPAARSTTRCQRRRSNRRPHGRSGARRAPWTARRSRPTRERRPRRSPARVTTRSR